MIRDPLCKTALAALALTLAATPGCEAIGLAPNEPDLEAVKEDPRRREADRVVVRHCLISFDGAGLPHVTRSRADAEALAKQVYERARAQNGLGDLVYLYTDDSSPKAPADGRYAVTNYGVRPASADEMERTALVPGFGDASFALEVGEITLVPYDERQSPFGWHVIERVK